MFPVDHSFWKLYRSVIFDCDDTLIVTAKKRWIALTTTASLLQIELRESTIRDSWGKPFDQLITDLLPGIDLQKFLIIYQDVMRRFAPEPALGAISLLQYLYDHQVHLEIVTSSYKHLIEQDLKELDILLYFSGIWGYEQTMPYYKPDPRVLEPVLTSLLSGGFLSSDVLYIGDSIRDYKVAVGNNLDFIAVTSGLDDNETFRVDGLREDRIVQSLELLIPA
jgi:phosphoglycolate phosphatase-like HAD superfamily hydrolase